MLAAAAAGAAASACMLLLSEHRSGRPLAQLPLSDSPSPPELVIAFEHSVLGTTVHDRYRFVPQPQLIEERFDGEGYGLPHVAGPGERLERDGSGWRLITQRDVQPLVVRPLPATRMRLQLGGREWPLAAWSNQAILITVQGCA